MPIDPPSPLVRSTWIVDDHEPDIVWCRRVLARSGRYGHVRAARSAQEALAWLDDLRDARARDEEAGPPDLVLLDLSMPGMDGFEFLHEVEARGSELEGTRLQVVVLSSSDDGRDIGRACASDLVVDYVVKPITGDDATVIADRIGSSAA